MVALNLQLTAVASLVLFVVNVRTRTLNTPDQYQYFQLQDIVFQRIPTRTSFVFSVKAANDVHILLQERWEDMTSDVYEIVLGGWANTQSAIRSRRQQMPPLTSAITAGIVSSTDWREFWISWDLNTVKVGRGATVGQSLIMQYVDDKFSPVSSLSVATGWGSSGEWQYKFTKTKTLSTPAIYQYRKLHNLEFRTSRSFVISVKAANDAHILLQHEYSSWLNIVADLYEIVLGGWANTLSVIRNKRQGTPLVSATTVGIVSSSEWREFWISLDSSMVKVGRGSVVGQELIMQSWSSDFRSVDIVHVSTGWGSTGQWRYDSIETETLSTSDNYQYTKLQHIDFQGYKTGFVVSILASNDGHILLQEREDDISTDIYELVVGGWANTRTVIRNRRQQTPLTSATTVGILSSTEWRKFWVAWNSNSVQIGRGSTFGKSLILEYVDTGITPVNFVSVSTGWGASGKWRYSITYCRALVLLGNNNWPHPDEFISTWNKLLAEGWKTFLGNDVQATQLVIAKERCNASDATNDRNCVYLDLTNIGKLIYRDILQLKQVIGGSAFHDERWYYNNYITAWFHHPQLHEFECESHWNSLWSFMAKLSKLESYDVVRKMKSVFEDRNTHGLRQEILKYCSKRSVYPICGVSTWIKTADKVGKLLEVVDRNTWMQDTEHVLALKGAIGLHFYGVKVFYQKLNQGTDASEFLSTTESDIKGWIKRVVFYIYEKITASEVVDVANVVRLLPESYELPCVTADIASLSRAICTFRSIIMQLRSYVSAYIHRQQTKGTPVMKILTYKDIDYEEFLNQKRLEQIIGVVQSTQRDLLAVAQQLQNTISNGFVGVQSYFQTMAKFDKSKAEADVGYISGTIAKYKQSYGSLSLDLTTKLGNLIEFAVSAISSDVATSAGKLAIQVARICNPISWITGDADPVDVLEAAEDFAQKVASLTRTISFIGALSRLKNKALTYMNKMRENEIFWNSVSSVVKKLSENTETEEFEEAKAYFLDQYNKYTPASTKEHLVGITEAWKGLVGDVCDLIESTESIFANTLKAGLMLRRACPNTKVDAEKLGVVLEEMYDLQFDLIDAMVDYVRALASSKAAEAISKDFSETTTGLKDNPNIYMELELLSGFSMTSYKITISSAIESYCDILEYREGTRPLDCKGLGTTITDILSRQKTTCATSTTEEFRFVPTKPSKSGDTAYLNAKDLYAGKIVPFRIPDSQWMVHHNWLLDSERDDVIFVQRFEIYLPTDTSGRTKWTKAKVTASAGHINQLRTPDGTNYVLNPPRTLVYYYEEGRSSCRQDMIDNPYEHYSCKSMPDICPLTSDSSHTGIYDIYPSIYAYWRIRLEGYSHLTVPDTDFSIVVGLKLCKISMTVSTGVVRNVHSSAAGMKSNSNSLLRLLRILEEERAANDEEQRSENTVNCCENNQYMSQSTHTCTPCPAGSKERYGGLFCGNVTRLELAPIVGETIGYFTFEEAKATCENAGTAIASPSDMAEAVSLGYDACACGWLSDGSIMAPQPSSTCKDSIVEDTTTCNGRSKWDVYCLNNF